MSYIEHSDIVSDEEMFARFPRPWSNDHEGRIFAADGTVVVETDSGYYPPGAFTAAFICMCVNEQMKHNKRDRN